MTLSRATLSVPLAKSLSMVFRRPMSLFMVLCIASTLRLSAPVMEASSSCMRWCILRSSASWSCKCPPCPPPPPLPRFPTRSRGCAPPSSCDRRSARLGGSDDATEACSPGAPASEGGAVARAVAPSAAVVCRVRRKQSAQSRGHPQRRRRRERACAACDHAHCPLCQPGMGGRAARRMQGHRAAPQGQEPASRPPAGRPASGAQHLPPPLPQIACARTRPDAPGAALIGFGEPRSAARACAARRLRACATRAPPPLPPPRAPPHRLHPPRGR
jgi:hypothetical protein